MIENPSVPLFVWVNFKTEDYIFTHFKSQYQIHDMLLYKLFYEE